MKRLILIFVFIAAICVSLTAQPVEFDKYFHDKTMRIDYYHAGNSETEIVSIDQIYERSNWGRNKINLIDNFNNGRYYVKIIDSASGKLIFSKGFDSYFGEYQTSDYALNGKFRTFHETAIIPSPKNHFKFVFEKRNKNKTLESIFEAELNPEDVMIIREDIALDNIEVIQSYNGNASERAVDIAILADGYTIEERDKFTSDVNYFTNVFFQYEPYASNKNKFNIYGVYSPSLDSGTDEPRAGIYQRTVLNSTFNSMGSERYLLTEDNKAVRNLADAVPYDAIYIMINHNRYGGGGIYNFFCTFTTGNQFRDYLFVHEFGHSFAGLADEYYTSSTSYNDFYPKGIEPVEANITALLDKENLKWNELLTSGIDLPSKWKKEEYDKMDLTWQKERAELNNKIAELKRNKAPREKITEAEIIYAEKDKQHSDKVDKYLNASKYWNQVGAFEGAGYSSEGLYRPMLDCIMFSKGNKPFCKVCESAIQKVIDFYCE
ncbi:MAG: M64 family metallopeptidase [Bacteroidota bacterium]|nr:IgA Peptidase M64 [Bacteroidota bacterium]